MYQITNKRRSSDNQIKCPPYKYSLSSNIFKTTSLQHFELKDKIFTGERNKSLSEIYAPQRLHFSKNIKYKNKKRKNTYLTLSKKKVVYKKKAPPQKLQHHWMQKGFEDTKENTTEDRKIHKKGNDIYIKPNLDYSGDTLVTKYTKMETDPTDDQEQISSAEIVAPAENQEYVTSDTPWHSMEQKEKESLTTDIIHSEEKKDSLFSEQDKHNSSNGLNDDVKKEERGEKQEVNDIVDNQKEEQSKSDETVDSSLHNKESTKHSDVQTDAPIYSNDNLEGKSIYDELEEAYKHFYETRLQVDELKKSIEKYKDSALTEEDINKFKEKEMQLTKKIYELESITQRLLHLGGWPETEKDIITDLGADLFMDDKFPTQSEKPENDVPKLTFGSEEKNDELVFSDRKTKQTSAFNLKECVKLSSNASDLISILNNEFSFSKAVMCQAGENPPKIFTCETRKKLNMEGVQPGWPHPSIGDAMEPKHQVMISLTDRLKESYTLQDYLVTENAHLEDFSYQLQEEVIAKEQALEDFKRKYNQLQSEMKVLVWENKQLNEKVNQRQQQKTIICKKELGKKMEENLLPRLEMQMKNLQKDLQCVQMARKEADRERCRLRETAMSLRSRPVTSPLPEVSSDKNNEKILQLKEQYARVKEDYKNKVTQVAALQVENENLLVVIEEKKKNLTEAENTVKDLQEKLLAAESEKEKMVGSKGQAGQLMVLEQQLRETKDELEELNIKHQESTYQEEYYRGKYLLAQQQVEEQRRQIDLMDADNKRITLQVEEELQRVKCQFQEKLDELKALPELLRTTQCRLQEALQKQKQAEEKNCELRVELEESRCKMNEANQKLEKFWTQHEETINQFESLKAKVDAWEKKCKDLQDINSKLNHEMRRLEDCAAQCRRCAEEKSMEIIQLNNQLECVREESARQIAKTKDRCETVRRSYQAQVEELERQLAQSRATAHAAQAERDETRKRMQCHINNLSENFEQAQSRIRYLQSHVNHLKTSFTNMLEDSGCQDMTELCDCE